MTTAELLLDAFGRIRDVVERVVDGLTPAQLAVRVDADANSIAWLVWHLTRIQDDHLAGAFGGEQVWTDDGWAARFALPFDASETGYGHPAAAVAAVQVESAGLLIGYHRAVDEQTRRYLRGVADPDLDRVVDDAWDPPVTLGVRLVSVIADGLQHAGQAAFVRGLVTRRGEPGAG
jgi:uncharacterized damage-inducible protein DinB